MVLDEGLEFFHEITSTIWTSGEDDSGSFSQLSCLKLKLSVVPVAVCDCGTLILCSFDQVPAGFGVAAPGVAGAGVPGTEPGAAGTGVPGTGDGFVVPGETGFSG